MLTPVTSIYNILKIHYEYRYTKSEGGRWISDSLAYTTLLKIESFNISFIEKSFCIP